MKYAQFWKFNSSNDERVGKHWAVPTAIYRIHALKDTY
jgi:hypothetical protein